MVTAPVGAGFTERHLEADGFAIRYLDGGDGPALCCFHGAGGLQLSRSHELLAASHRVVAFELPGFGRSPVNDRTDTLRQLGRTMARAIEAIGLHTTSLWGTSFGGKLALWCALDHPQLVDALVLAAPAAIRDGRPLPDGPALVRALYAHPDRVPTEPPLSSQVLDQQRALTARLIGPARDAELEAAMAGLATPTLVLFGTEDTITPPELGRHYRRLLPNAQLVLLYDAAHALDRDRPEAFAGTVAEFLARRDQFVVRQDSGLRYP